MGLKPNGAARYYSKTKKELADPNTTHIDRKIKI